MNLYLIEMFGISLLLTWIIELIVVWCFRIPFGRDWVPVVLVNALTNPVVVFICWLWRLYLPQMNSFLIQIPLEIMVVLSELYIYKSFAKSGWYCKKPLKLSMVANGASWLFGVLLSLMR